MNIYQKLILVRETVPYLKKDNTGFQFKYVSSSQTLGALRDAMDEQQLLLIPRVVKWEIRDHTTRKGDHEYFTTFDMEFTWVNAEKPEETITCPWVGCGLDDGEKGCGKAVTYAEKYFLLKFFNIATDKDDPDSFQKELATSRNQASKPPETEPQNDYDDPEYRMRQEIYNWGMKLVQGDETEYAKLLTSETAFAGKDGESHSRDSEDKLKGKWLNKTHHQIKILYERSFPSSPPAPTTSDPNPDLYAETNGKLPFLKEKP